MHIEFAGRKGRRDTFPSDSKSRRQFWSGRRHTSRRLLCNRRCMTVASQLSLSSLACYRAAAPRAAHFNHLHLPRWPRGLRRDRRGQGLVPCNFQPLPDRGNRNRCAAIFSPTTLRWTRCTEHAIDVLRDEGANGFVAVLLFPFRHFLWH